MSDGGPDQSSGSSASAATEKVLEWLGEVGARWGLPADACRVHGWLYLSAGKSTEAEISEAVALSLAQTRSALAWLGDHRLVDAEPGDRWHTGDDPWALVMRALERRRDQELPVALEVLRTTHRQAAADARLANRIGSLLAMVDDVAAIDAQAQRLSPQSLRRLIRAGGTVARLVNPLLGPKRKAAP